MNLSEDEALAASESLFADLAHTLGVGKLPSADGVARLRFEGDIEVELQGSAPGWFYVLYEAVFRETLTRITCLRRHCATSGCRV